MTEAEARAYTRGYDIATSRAESRRRAGRGDVDVEV
jgi:hypothetical protein